MKLIEKLNKISKKFCKKFEEVPQSLGENY